MINPHHESSRPTTVWGLVALFLWFSLGAACAAPVAPVAPVAPPVPLAPAVSAPSAPSAGFASSVASDPSNPEKVIHFPTQKVGAFNVGLDFLTPEVEIGQPLQIRFHYTLVRHTAVNKFQISWNLSTDLVVLVTFPGFGQVRIRGENYTLMPPSAVYQVGVGETQYLEKSLIYVDQSFTGLIFEKPGTYPVKVMLRCGPQGSKASILEFPVVNVKVTVPGPDTMPEVKYLLQLPAEECRSLVGALQKGLATAKTAPMMETLLKVAPQSPLAPYALAALVAQAHFQNNNEETVRLALEFHRRFPRHLLADDMLSLAYDAYQALGDKEKARQVAFELYLDYPRSDVIRTYGDIYKNVILPALRPASNEGWMLFDSADAPTQKEWDTLVLGKPLVKAMEEMHNPKFPKAPPAGPPPAPEEHLTPFMSPD